MKDAIKNITPKFIRRFIHSSMLEVNRIIYSGNQVYCNCCDSSFSKFLPMKEGSHPRDNVSCPGCGSAERHRMLLMYLREYEKSLFPKGTRVLYIAPMRGIRNYFKSLGGVEYIGADLESALAEMHFDLQEIPLPDNSHDFCICSHTLAHIPDDIKALQELRRVLVPDGKLIVMERLYDRRETYQNPNVRTRAERLEHYEQDDRWRIYGQDFIQRLSAVGFEVEELDYVKTIDDSTKEKYGFNPIDRLYICKNGKPN